MLLRVILPLGFVAFLVVYVVLNLHQEGVVLTDEVRESAPGNFMTLEAGKVHYSLKGADSLDLIVFIHGGGITGMEVWEQNTKYFIDHGYRVLTFDLYGRGYSDRPDQEHSPLLFEKQFTQMISGLGIIEPFHLVAMSLGGIIALDYHQKHPEQIKKMVFIDPAISGNHKMKQILKVPVVSDIIMTFYWFPMSIQNQKKEFFEKRKFVKYSERVSHFMKIEGYKQTAYSTWMHLLNQNKMALLSGVDPSQLMVIYGGQDPYFNMGQVRLFQTQAPLVQMVKVDSAGHLPHYEKPDLVNRLIHSFVESDHTRITLTNAK